MRCLHTPKCRIDDRELPESSRLMIYSSLLHGATFPAYSGPDLDPYPATSRSNPSAPTRQSRPSTSMYFVCPSSRAPQTRTSCTNMSRQTAAHLASARALRRSPVAGLRWHPPPRQQRLRCHLLESYVEHLVLFAMTRNIREETTMDDERVVLRLSPLGHSCISFLLHSRYLSFSSCTSLPIFFPSRSRRRASLFAILALSSTRRCQMRSIPGPYAHPS